MEGRKLRVESKWLRVESKKDNKKIKFLII